MTDDDGGGWQGGGGRKDTLIRVSASAYTREEAMML